MRKGICGGGLDRYGREKDGVGWRRGGGGGAEAGGRGEKALRSLYGVTEY